MNIDEIRQKYANDTRTRQQEIKEAERHYNAMLANLNYLMNEREKLRPKTGLMSNEDRQQWNALTFQIGEARQKADKAGAEYDQKRIAANIDDIITKTNN